MNKEFTQAFDSFEKALRWAMVHGRENCLPCHKWSVEQDGREYRVAVRYRASNDLVGYAV